jgi:hypothetical protein
MRAPGTLNAAKFGLALPGQLPSAATSVAKVHNLQPKWLHSATEILPDRDRGLKTVMSPAASGVFSHTDLYVILLTALPVLFTISLCLHHRQQTLS